jgi:hypothetical protein
VIGFISACCKKKIEGSDLKNAYTTGSANPTDFQAKDIKNNNAKDHLGQYKILKCKDIHFDPIKENTYYWMNFINCLKDSLITNNKFYEEKYVELLESKINFQLENEWQKAEVMFRVTLRGEYLFKKLLANSNVFYCYKDRSIRESGQIQSIHKFYFNSYTSMIRNIDGLSVEEYLLKVNPNTSEKLEQHFKDKCQETEYRNNYNAIKAAYEKGLVVLKDYGED